MKKSNVKSVKVKPIKLTIGDRQLDFVLDLNAFSEIEDTYGSIGELMGKIDQGSMKAIRSILWAGLQNNENPPTEKEVGANIQLNQLEEYSKLIAQAMGVALPEQEEIDPN
jgi:hypothetical protein